ncbi:hypothetical protein NDU88_007206 [Pleurodeles waltl]|uniref:Uncharacterized protein n=1 Tax=Pleurodeles waltl TaxID=8319 RepID=A0AAV7SRN5_PLEWA|nr:hypothetical protein NDU88_007206 [Pleurodeles waltl]
MPEPYRSCAGDAWAVDQECVPGPRRGLPEPTPCEGPRRIARPKNTPAAQQGQKEVVHKTQVRELEECKPGPQSRKRRSNPGTAEQAPGKRDYVPEQSL